MKLNYCIVCGSTGSLSYRDFDFSGYKLFKVMVNII